MGRRQIIELPGITHGAPIPLAAKVGNIMFSSGVNGRDAASGKMPEDPKTQAEMMFKNIGDLMKAAGGSTDDIVYIQLRMKDRQLREHIDPEWLKMFPDEHDRPARHASQEELGGGMLMQASVIAVLP